MRTFLLWLSLFLSSSIVHATHIVGGELVYRPLGNNLYEVTLRLYRDCSNPNNSPFDTPITILTVVPLDNTGTPYGIDIPVISITSVPPPFNNPCLGVPSNVCVQEGLYRDTISLATNTFGYDLVYSNCCRNQTIDNLSDPGSLGVYYTARVPNTTLINHNPDFVNFPPIALCINDTFNFNHYAYDADGDSLAYNLCNPLDELGNPVLYSSNYSANYPMNSSPALAIDNRTGMLICKPTQLGQFVIGICVSEYRNGVLLSTNLRDFQFNIVNCVPGPVPFDIADTTTCGAPVNLTLQAPQHPDLQYRWSDGSTNSSLVVTMPGTYWVTTIASCGNYTDTIHISNTTLVIDRSVLPDTIASCTNNFPLFSVDAEYIYDYNYLWNTGSTDSYIYDVNTGVYTVRLSNIYNTCMIIEDTVRLIASDNTLIPVNLGRDTALCFGGGNSITLSVPYNFNYFYEWNNFNFGSQIEVYTPGTYWVQVSDETNCAYGRDTIVISNAAISNLPFDLGANIALCNFNTNNSVVIRGPIGNYAYTWNTGENTPNITVNNAGTYQLTISDLNNPCVIGSDVVTVVNQAVGNLPFSLGSDTAFCFKPEQTTIAYQLNGPQQAHYTYTWNNQSHLSSLSITQLGTYTLVITDTMNCLEGQDAINISKFEEYQTPLANVVTPNGDNLNETFPIEIKSKNFELWVYNRWGERVFHGSTPWPANSVVEGTYYYVVTEDVCSESIESKGTVTVIK